MLIVRDYKKNHVLWIKFILKRCQVIYLIALVYIYAGYILCWNWDPLNVYDLLISIFFLLPSLGHWFWKEFSLQNTTWISQRQFFNSFPINGFSPFHDCLFENNHIMFFLVSLLVCTLILLLIKSVHFLVHYFALCSSYI